MSYNKKSKNSVTIESIYKLENLGVFLQDDGTIALATNALNLSNLNNLELEIFQGPSDVIKYLDNDFMESCGDFSEVADDLETFLLECLTDDGNIYNNVIEKELGESFLISLHKVFSNYDDFTKICDLIIQVKKKENLSTYSISYLSYYLTLLSSMSDRLVLFYRRKTIIEEILSSRKFSTSQVRKVKALYLGVEEGIGPWGRTNPQTPYSNFDGIHDRVMDGREIKDWKGHVYETFYGPLGANKFKNKPLKIKRNFTYKHKPLRSKPKLRHQKRQFPGGSNYRYIGVKEDPAYMVWPDTQRNTAYSWADRSDESLYPSWSKY